MFLILFLFVLFVPTFNVLVSTLVDVCAHSALYNPVSATLSFFCSHSHFRLLCICPCLCLCPISLFVYTVFLSRCFLLPTLCLSAIVSLPSFLFAHGFCLRSDLFVSTLLVLFVPTLGVCVYSRRCLRPLCFYPLCVLLVFLSILFHTKSYEPFISGMYGMWMHILIHAFCKIFNWTIYQLCRCILQFTRLELHIQFEPLDLHILVDQLLWEKWDLTYQKRA